MSTSRPMSSNDSALSSIITEGERQQEIYYRFSLSVLGLLAQTSKQYEAETAFLRLLPAAIHAAPEFLDPKEDATALASIALLKKHPELLFKKKKVTDHYGREIWASSYQIFLGTGDIWALKQVHEEIIPKIKNGKTKAEAQFKEQFPHYDITLDNGVNDEARFYDDRNKRQIEEIVKIMTMMKNTMGNAKEEAYEALRKLLQPKSGEVIRSGEYEKYFV